MARPLVTPVPGGAPVEEDVGGQSTQKISGEAEWTFEPTPALEPPAALTSVVGSDPVRKTPEEADEAAKAAGCEPPVDWFEPLEDDDYDDESLAGESERSESVAGSETVFKKVFQMPRRKRSHPDEGWDEWSILGEGWKRKEVVRRSGSSIGQKDVYYLSPRGDRVRSRVELISLMEGQLDLSTFEYKSGKFYNGEAPPIRIRHRTKFLPVSYPVREKSVSVLPQSPAGWREATGPTLPTPTTCPPPAWVPKTSNPARPWIPCGQCVGCHNTTNCGQCANCKHGLQSPESRKRLCRKRKCICPIRKVSSRVHDGYCLFGCLLFHPSLKSSDTENFSVNVDVDEDEDMSTDDDDDKRKRRSCGECKACLCRKDCGTCDFCVDKPKFGGSNKKRQKCRLRQCQRQAMRHLLPYQRGHGDHGPDGQLLPGRPRPHYTYSRKSDFKRSRGSQYGLDFTDNEDDDCNLKPITQIFSLAETPSGSGADIENQLMTLLQSLRSSAMPIMWYAIMVEGPQLQLIQCSKQSSLSDTIVLIDPGFCYQVTVQKQPLLPTHPLYDQYPARMTSVTQVVSLLLGLEDYVVCQGLPPKEPLSNTNPIILERASTCDFLVRKKVSVCANCRALQGL
uniref:Methyl-CpG-binding domain protein 1b n=1 Tax=Cyclopterus lumpus TaxID=8103 RepID=A0A8C2ZD16_CYCLU